MENKNAPSNSENFIALDTLFKKSLRDLNLLEDQQVREELLLLRGHVVDIISRYFRIEVYHLTQLIDPTGDKVIGLAIPGNKSPSHSELRIWVDVKEKVLTVVMRDLTRFTITKSFYNDEEAVKRLVQEASKVFETR